MRQKFYNVPIIPKSQAECNQLASLVHSHKLNVIHYRVGQPFKVGVLAWFWGDGQYTPEYVGTLFTDEPKVTVNEFAQMLNTGV